MNCDCIVMKSKDIEISIPKDIFNNVDKGIRAKFDDDGSLIIEKIQFERKVRPDREQLNNILKKVNK
ncbi:hypothetical protein QYB58_000719 [Clostridium perfringens]|nr:hypothetical protein [Clostridium perfringens]